jgi:recombination protein RecA
LGLREGVVEKSGAWYSVTSDARQLGQGREKAKIFLEENPEIAAELDRLIREKILANQGGAAARVSGSNLLAIT